VRRVLLVGGAGAFGTLAAERLVRDPSIALVIAGRERAKAEAAARRLGTTGSELVSAMVLDAAAPDLDALRAVSPSVIYNASGPYQRRNPALARAAIAVGAHYVDLADARDFVMGINALDTDAKAAGVLVVSGASSVPGLSSAVVENLRPSFLSIQTLRWGIAPGNAFDAGVGTTASVLGGLGKPFTTRRGGRVVTVYGWQGLSRFAFDGIGTRWLAHVDIPDLALFPIAFPEIETLDFRAGLEMPLQHFGLWALSWPARMGLLPFAPKLAPALLAAKRWLRRFGTDTGGMFVEATGTDHDGKPLTRTWQVIARRGDGPYIPHVPATVLTRRLLDGTETRRGAMACVGLMTIDQFMAEVADLSIEIIER
jgi:saccharopine dehydrogenase-like NADP-dependent oxidoreductase